LKKEEGKEGKNMTIWNEADHPRDEDGKFTYKNGGASTSSISSVQDRADILYPTMKNTEVKADYNFNGLGNYKNENLSREDLFYPTMKNKKYEDKFTDGVVNMNTSEMFTPIKGNSKGNNILLKGYVSYDNSDKNFYDSLGTIFGHEGGYTNDPDDLGGPTNMGITQSTYNNYCKKHNLKTKDVKNLTKKEAVQVYYEDYWKASGADKVDNPIGALILFDTAILHGVGRAKQYYKTANGDFDKVIEQRRKHYEKRVKENPSQKKYLKGWNNRADHLSKMLKDYNEKIEENY